MTGTGFAQPKIGAWLTASSSGRINVPNGSICLIGLRRAAGPCAQRWVAELAGDKAMRDLVEDDRDDQRHEPHRDLVDDVHQQRPPLDGLKSPIRTAAAACGQLSSVGWLPGGNVQVRAVTALPSAPISSALKV